MRCLSYVFVAVVLAAVVLAAVGCASPLPHDAPPAAPVPAPAPAVPRKVKLLLFTQKNCPPCDRLKGQLHDPALREPLSHCDLEIVTYPDPRFAEYVIRQTPTLVALTDHGPEVCPHGGMTLGQLAEWLGAREAEQAFEKYVAGKIHANGPQGPDGVTVVADLPESLRAKNVGGRDGAGLCVFTSLMHSARWSNESHLWDFQKDMRAESGGGWPDKVDAMIKKYGNGTRYIQYEGRDSKLLELALRCGKMPAVTYNGHDGVFYSTVIAHMVNLTYLDPEHPADGRAPVAAILDNNNIDKILWMSRQEFLDRWIGGRQGWAVILLSNRPPAVPRGP